MSYHIAIDIGASSGRLMLAEVDKDTNLKIQEIHRFENNIKKINEFYRWEINELIYEIILGMEKAKLMGIDKATVGIDTWAVDYCLIDKEGKLIDQPISYRDNRTENIMNEVFTKMSKKEIYEKTGIQFQEFNTLFQLYVENKELIDKTDKILMIPDYISYVLTGRMVAETTNISTTQLMNIASKDFDNELLETISINKNKFPKLTNPGTILGPITPDLKSKYNLPDCTIISVATHDTASAILGVPTIDEEWIYLSSGTWSLIGVENKKAIISEEALSSNYSNEWGAYDTFRFLKNIPGMWFIQEIARNLDYKYSFEEMAEKAKEVEPFLQLIDLEDNRFNNPTDMIQELKDYCSERNLVIPMTVGELTMCIYSNLALAYTRESKKIEKLTNKKIDIIHIVGGGSNIDLLNQLTADCTKKEIIAGPSEATAIGNILVQLITTGFLKDIKDARKWLRDQIEIKKYSPSKTYIGMNKGK